MMGFAALVHEYSKPVAVPSRHVVPVTPTQWNLPSHVAVSALCEVASSSGSAVSTPYPHDITNDAKTTSSQPSFILSLPVAAIPGRDVCPITQRLRQQLLTA